MPLTFLSFLAIPSISEVVTLGSFYKETIFWLHDIMFFRKGDDSGRRDIKFMVPRAPAEAFSVRCHGAR